MLKKTITYTDYDGNQRTEDFYFNLTEAEITEMEYSAEGGLSAKLQRIIQSKDQPSIIKTFKELILAAYGKKSDDGRRFIKNNETAEEFKSMEAYSILFMELATDADKAASFVNEILPKRAKK